MVQDNAPPPAGFNFFNFIGLVDHQPPPPPPPGLTVDQLMAGATFDADGNLKNWYMTGRNTALYGFIRLYTALYGFIRLYTDLYGFIRLYTALYGFIRLYTALYGFIRLYTALYG
jgi:hypothetical protein